LLSDSSTCKTPLIERWDQVQSAMALLDDEGLPATAYDVERKAREACLALGMTETECDNLRDVYDQKLQDEERIYAT
jgi:hypothetical protein